MNENQLKHFLTALYTRAIPPFEVRYSGARTKALKAKYIRHPPTIVIYTRKNTQRMAIIGAGIHELAHHVNYANNGTAMLERLRKTGREPHHGQLFRRTLEEIVGRFNFLYREHVKGIFVVNPRRVSAAPVFQPFAQSLRAEFQSGNKN